MQQHEPGEYQFHTFHSREEKIQPGKLIYHPLNVILAVLSLLYGILLSLNASWSAGFIFLSLIDILIINSAFFYLMSIGKKRIENKKKGLFFGIAFISAVILVYFAPAVSPEGIVYFLGVWIIAVLLNTVLYQYGVMK
ncbi:MAG TPA: hypothetical protein VKY19_29600 [Ktedonosporobacter sp.]|jgi:uncharacterized membrane protein HdeD (DUF308 family)|nr:hypothetical protein [Ktedonosporobacter sp.]